MVKCLVPSALRMLRLSHEDDGDDALDVRTLVGWVKTFAIAK